MATNTGNNTRKGSVKNRIQIKHPSNSGFSIKIDTKTGRFMNVTKGTFKGVAKEVDNRRK